jgi:hypothetical protein
MKSLSILTLLAIFGIAAAASFFRPAAPHQVPNAVPRGGADFVMNVAFDDADLDNPLIEADGNINAARKCGFCMGVSTALFLYEFLLLFVRNNDVSCQDGSGLRCVDVCCDQSL